MARRRIKHLAGNVTETITGTFPLSRSGWTAARQKVYEARDRAGAGYATLMCPKGSIPLYQCYTKSGCTIEGSDGDAVLAGSRRGRRRGRKR